jgi:hypothetical protein
MTITRSLPAGASACTAYCPPGAIATACDSVLVVYADDPQWAADVQNRLRGTGAFSTVDLFNANTGTPTAEQLAAYHAVLVYSNQRFNNTVLLGDRLAAFHDQGGGVVVALFANQGGSWIRLHGAYGTAANGYALLDYASGDYIYLQDSLGDVLEPDSPLMNGVAYFAAQQAYRSTAPVIGGRGVVVARWQGGGREPLVVRGVRGSRTLVELNFFPPSSAAAGGTPDFKLSNTFWFGFGPALLRNALKYSRCTLCAPGTFATAGKLLMKEWFGESRGGTRGTSSERWLDWLLGGMLGSVTVESSRKTLPTPPQHPDSSSGCWEGAW